MDAIATVLVAAATMLFGLMAVVPLLVDAEPVRRNRSVSMRIVVRNDDDRGPVRAA